MRVLHLIDAAGPQATGTTLALLKDSQPPPGSGGARVVLLGGSKLRLAAHGSGIRNPAALGVPFGHALGGIAAVKRMLKDWGRFDLIHTWSIGTLVLATLLQPRCPRVLTLTIPPTKRQAGWLGVLTTIPGASRSVLLPISNTIRRAVLSAGSPKACVHVLRPSIDLGRIPRDRGQALRAAWGIHDDHTKVVALLGDPLGAADAMDAMMAVGLAAESYGSARPDRLRLLLHPDQHRRTRAQHALQIVGRSRRLSQEPGLAHPWTVLPGCDVALVPAAPCTGAVSNNGPDLQSGGGLSLLWAMAANVPIVGEATYGTSEIVEDRHSALLARPRAPRFLAHRIRQVLDDRDLAWRVRDTARHEAFSYFSKHRYGQNLQLVYAQVLGGQEVQVPALESTGGLRFAGRA